MFGFSFTWAPMWASGAKIVRQERHHLRSSKFVFWHDVERGVAVGVVVAFFLHVEVLEVGPSRVVLGLVVASATSSLFAACAAARLLLGFHFVWMIILIIRCCFVWSFFFVSVIVHVPDAQKSVRVCDKCMSFVTTKPKSFCGAQYLSVVWTHNDFLSEYCLRNTQGDRIVPT